MARRFDDILDECVERIQQGASLEECLASFPEHAAELEPALRALSEVLAAYSFAPSPAAKAAARQRFYAALESRQRRRELRPPLLERLFGGSRVWVSAAVVLLIVVAGYFGLRPVLFPGGPAPVAQENFAFLISDEVNAIGDFQSLDITITSIGLLQGGESGQWLELEPQVKEVDLTLLQGENAQGIWRGNVPEGRYTKVFIYVSSVRGILEESGATVDVKLPSNKLQMNSPFEVTADSVVSFVYDLTVIARGNLQSGIRYLLQPQVDQSGAHQPYQEVVVEPEQPPVEGLTLTFSGEVAPGASLVLTVTDSDGNVVAGAQVTVNGEVADETTDEFGQFPILVPETATKLEVKVQKDGLEGEIEWELVEETLELQLSLLGETQPGAGLVSLTEAQLSELQPGAEVTLLVTVADVPLEGATVLVNGEAVVDITDSDGLLVLTIPAEATEVVIIATLDGLEGSLEITLV